MTEPDPQPALTYLGVGSFHIGTPDSTFTLPATRYPIADPRHPARREPAVIDKPRLTPNPDGGVILHLPNINYLDTQVWSVDIGLTQAGLDDLRALLARADEPAP
ncbi:hypothetical protein ADK52_25460 [Streptomyces sp. WM6372]|uniref:hypothetical protein n=1 Tax=Streptomyces sp. WM6372 TaxID=1415555 RepID=UPI0006AEA56C|nr:hypothetical protein [Streptomyces sp. WM6372]KOU20940.1 hypothetical protein ADK52_25460 [Streptomyces sp. WM6372]